MKTSFKEHVKYVPVINLSLSLYIHIYICQLICPLTFRVNGPFTNDNSSHMFMSNSTN